MRYHLATAFVVTTLFVSSFVSCGSDDKDSGGGGATDPYASGGSGSTATSGSTASGDGSTATSGSTTTGSDTGSSSTTVIAFTDVSPIIKTRCATSNCHDGTISPNYKDVTEANFKKTNAKGRVSAGTMPPSSATKLTADEKAKILGFFGE